jgi:hypothetical protein
VTTHYRENGDQPTPEWIRFWLTECRSPELLLELLARFPRERRNLASARPLLAQATAGHLAALREALDAEVRAEQEKDRAYWSRLKRELEAFRRAEREGPARPKPGRLSQADPRGEA